MLYSKKTSTKYLSKVVSQKNQQDTDRRWCPKNAKRHLGGALLLLRGLAASFRPGALKVGICALLGSFPRLDNLINTPLGFILKKRQNLSFDLTLARELRPILKSRRPKRLSMADLCVCITSFRLCAEPSRFLRVSGEVATDSNETSGTAVAF